MSHRHARLFYWKQTFKATQAAMELGVAAVAGSPNSLLFTYAAFLEGLWYFNKLAAGQGAAHDYLNQHQHSTVVLNIGIQHQHSTSVFNIDTHH